MTNNRQRAPIGLRSFVRTRHCPALRDTRNRHKRAWAQLVASLYRSSRQPPSTPHRPGTTKGSPRQAAHTSSTHPDRSKTPEHGLDRPPQSEEDRARWSRREPGHSLCARSTSAPQRPTFHLTTPPPFGESAFLAVAHSLSLRTLIWSSIALAWARSHCAQYRASPACAGLVLAICSYTATDC